MVTVLKIVLGRDIHLYKGELTLNAIKQHCCRMFKAIPSHFQFTYIDADGDQITVNSEADVQMIQELYQNQMIKLKIREVETSFEVIGSESSEGSESCQYLLIQGKNCLKEEKNKKDEEEAIKESVTDFLIETQKKLVEKIMKEEEESMLEEQVRKYISNLTDQCCQKALQEEVCQAERKSIGIQKTVRRLSVNPEIELDKNETISKMIDEKLNDLLPGIISQATKKASGKIEQKLKKIGAGTRCCCECAKKQSKGEFLELINTELIKKINRKSRKSRKYSF